jgi:tRNA(Ile)-lysidine synthase
VAERSHPPSLRTLIDRTLRDHRLVAPGDTVLVAVSGGPDSTALLHGLALLRERRRLTLVACGVDHGLRAEAARELAGVEALANRLGVPFVRRDLQVAPGGNLQARARTARHAALAEAALACGAAHIATGHHAEDRAETVLLRLLRGSGPRGLACLPPRSGQLIRPMIFAPRSAIDAHLARHGLPTALDPSNDDPRFLRTRVRKELLPLLRALSPGIVNHLTGLSDDLLPYSDLFPPDDLRRPHRQVARSAALRGKPHGDVVVRIAGADRVVAATEGGRRFVVREPATLSDAPDGVPVAPRSVAPPHATTSGPIADTISRAKRS